MKIFDLPKTTEFGRVIPKNYFDGFTNTRQKKDISTLIQRIRWQYKLATSTTNLPSKDLEEIQVLVIELKIKNQLKSILSLIDKVIPYHIIFILKYDTEILVSTALKHSHPSKPNETVTDCIFQTEWQETTETTIQLTLKQSLEWTYMNFCNQITGQKVIPNRYADFVAQSIEIQKLKAKITHLEKQVYSAKQFNIKVNLNIKLTKLKKELRQFQN